MTTIANLILGWTVGCVLYGVVSKKWGTAGHTTTAGIMAIVMTAAALGAFTGEAP